MNDIEKKAAEAKKIHDFGAPIQKTSVQLAKIILNKMVENFDNLVYDTTDITQEEQDKYIEKLTDVCIEIQNLMVTTDIPVDYATEPMKKIIHPLIKIIDYIEGTSRTIEDELLSRVLNVKSPITNKYAKDCATFGEKLLKLNEIREGQGNNIYDFFEEPKKDANN